MNQTPYFSTPRVRSNQSVPRNPGSGARVWIWLGRVLVIGLAILVAMALLRIVGLLFFRSHIAEAAGDLARIGGADAHLAGWMTGLFPLLTSMLLIGHVFQLIKGFFIPGSGGAKVVRSAILFLGLTLLVSLAPGILKSLMQVDDEGWPDMVEVDPATERWFNRDGVARIYYADHLDGERRFWNAPGSTPYDRAKAEAVSEEVYRSWLEKNKRQAGEKLREREAEEARMATEAETSRRRQEEAVALEKLEMKLAELRQLSEKHAAEVRAAAAPKTPVYVPARAVSPVVPVVPAPAPTMKVADHRFEVIPGRVLELNLQRRLGEIWTDAAVEFSQSGSATVVVLGSHSLRTLSGIESIRVRSIGNRPAALYLRWIDGLEDRRMPSVTYSGHETASTTSATVPVRFTPAPAPAVPPVQRFGLGVGQVFRLEIGGDTVEVWSDGPFHLAAGAGGSVREVWAGQRMKISGADFLVASASAPETTVLNVQMITPSSRRVSAAVSAKAAEIAAGRR